MRWGRGLVLLLALAAAGGAAMIVRGVARVPVASAPKAEIAMAEVLVAAGAVAAGQMVEAKDLRWQPWPVAALPRDAVQRTGNAAPPAFKPAPARHPIAAGEPITDAKLARPGEGGVMASLIAPGKRAVAVAVRDESAAGGFIQPHDRVDVLWTRRVGEGGGGAAKSAASTVLRGAKVLAIGKALGARDGASGEGRTATLELTPAETRIIAQAKAGGDISLALIPAADIGGAPVADEAAGLPQAVQIVKFGRRSSTRAEQ